MEKIFNWIEKNDKKILIISLIIGITFFFFLNCITPFIIDDYISMDNPAKNINDFFSDIMNNYYTWNGRLFLNIFVAPFCTPHIITKNKMIFNIENTIFYFLFLFLIYKIVKKNEKFKSIYLGVIFIAFWLFTPAFGQDFLWVSGVYMYMGSIISILLFIIPYINSLEHKKTNIIWQIVIIPLGLVAGCCVENGSAAILFFLLAYLLRKIIIKEKLKTFELFGFIAFVIGFLILIISPGSRNRATQIQQITGDSVTSIYQLIHTIIKRAYYITFDTCKELSFLLITSAIVLFELIHQKKFKFIHFLYILSFFASIYSMVLAPFFQHRAYLFPVVFLILFIFDGFSTIKIEEQGKRFIIAASLVSAVVFLHSTTVSTLDILNTRQRWNERIRIIEEGKVNGIMDYEFKIIHSGERHNAQWNLEDLNPYDNTAIADYYGINSIVGYE